MGCKVETHCIAVLWDRAWSRGGRVILVWLLPRLLTSGESTRVRMCKGACSPWNDAGNPAVSAARSPSLMDAVMSSDHEGCRACGEVKLNLVIGFALLIMCLV